jgi:hypothetical protein
MAVWGLIVAALLVIGALPFFVGLAVVVPVLGHATWHTSYRKVVVPDPASSHAQPLTPDRAASALRRNSRPRSSAARIGRKRAAR